MIREQWSDFRNGFSCLDCWWPWPLVSTPPSNAVCDICGGKLVWNEPDDNRE